MSSQPEQAGRQPVSGTTSTASTAAPAAPSTTPATPAPAKPVIKPETVVETAIREAKVEASELPLSPAPAPEPKKSLWVRVKDEAIHYWHGTKLLGAELVISGRLLIKLLNGHKLTRREMRQLRRTTGDLLRLVPFVVIVAIPFLELALPLLLRFFPNMLPSTFESKFQEEEKKKKLLKVRIQMAKFLQETVAEFAISGASNNQAAKEFNEFFMRYRNSGQSAPSEEILRIARKFQDELTLTNLSRPQLISMAKYMNLNAFGTDTFLRHQIERRLKYLEADDQLIAAEGVDSLSMQELQQVCLARGIRTVGVSPARMRSELQQWLDLHLVHKIPSSLLLLSQAFLTTERLPASMDDAIEKRAEALQATLSSLPHQVINEAQLKVNEASGVATNKQKLEVLKEQEEMIADELEQEAAVKAAKKAKGLEATKKAKEELGAAAKTAAPAALDAAAAATAASPSTAASATPAAAVSSDPAATPAASAPAAPTEAPAAPATAPVPSAATAAPPAPAAATAAAAPIAAKPAASGIPASAPAAATADKATAAAPAAAEQPATAAAAPAPEPEVEEKLSEEELKKLGEAIKTITTDSALSDVKEDLDDLKEEQKDFKEDIEELVQVTQKTVSKTADRLTSRVDKMISGIENELAKYDSEIGSKLNLVRPDEEGKMPIEELESALRVIRDHPNDDRIKRILTHLDSDNDGMVALKEILTLVEESDNEGHGEIIPAKRDEEKKAKDKPAAAPTPAAAAAAPAEGAPAAQPAAPAQSEAPAAASKETKSS